LYILHQISVGIFEIEKAKVEIITQLTEEQRELIRIFNMDEKGFSNFKEAKRIVG
jgi:hypothetical protein